MSDNTNDETSNNIIDHPKKKLLEYNGGSVVITIPKFLKTIFLIIFNLGGVGAIIVLLFNNNVSLKTLETKMEETATKQELTSVSSQLDITSQSIDSLQDSINSLKLQVGILENTSNFYKGIATSNFGNTLGPFSTNDSIKSITAPMWEESDVLATDLISGEKFTAPELHNQKLLLSYEESGSEVFFYGQFSSNNKWDGNCIINVYRNDKLEIITDAFYEDGVLKYYEQVYQFVTSSNENVWCVSKRECTNNGNIGVSWNYFKNQDVEKDFTLEQVQPEYIYNVGKFKEQLNTQLESLYYGITSNGKYNDTSGEAYLVKFSKLDGTVRTLYVGQFKDGKFFDNTGDAWYITRNDNSIDFKYMYYIGNFDEKPIDETNEDNFKSDIDKQFIDDKL